MPEVAEQVVEQPISNETNISVQTPSTFNPFDSSTWSETPQAPKAAEAVTQTVVETPAAPVEAPKTEEEIFDEAQYLKDRFGFDSADLLKKELEDLKASKAKGIEFANEDSKRLFEYIREGKEDEAYDIIHRKKTVEKLLKSDFSDKLTAEQVVKLGMKNDTGLSDDEIDFLYKKKFSAPAKPVQKIDETDEEFAPRLTSWEESVKEKEMELTIEAKLAKPKLEKLKSDLILPEIKREAEPKVEGFSQEELAKIEEARKVFLTSLEQSIPKFNGYETKAIGEGTEIPISYQVTQEERVELKKALEDFDLGTFIQERWFSKIGEYDTTALAEDLYLLRNKGKIFQKIATDAASKSMAAYIKQQNNIHVTGEPIRTNTGESAQENLQKQVEFFWNTKY